MACDGQTDRTAAAALTFVERLYGVRGQPLAPIIAQFGVADGLAPERAGIVVAEHREYELAAERVPEQVGNVLYGYHAGGRVRDVRRHRVTVKRKTRARLDGRTNRYDVSG